MTQEFFTLTLQDLETILTKSSCGCHFINPNKTRLILWKEIQNGIETYYLRIGMQKFVSYPLKDKNKCPYWKFNPYLEKFLETKKEPKTSPGLDSITKFHQRQAQFENYDREHNAEQFDNRSFT